MRQNKKRMDLEKSSHKEHKCWTNVQRILQPSMSQSLSMRRAGWLRGSIQRRHLEVLNPAGWFEWFIGLTDDLDNSYMF